MDLKFSEAFALSSSNLRRHSLRSTLTATGIAVGVATVIALMTLGSSFEAYFVYEYNSTFATNSFTIQPQTNDVAAEMATTASPLYVFPVPVFSEHDIIQLTGLSSVRTVIPYSTAFAGNDVKVDGAKLTTAYGVEAVTISPLIFTDGFLKLASGAVANTSSQAMVGSTLALSLAYEAGSTNDTDFALGHQLTIESDAAPKNFTIVGVLKESPLDTTLNTAVYLPLLQDPTSSTGPVYNGVVILSDAVGDLGRAEANALGYLNTNSDGLKTLTSSGQGLAFAASSSTGASSFLQQQVNEYTTIILAMGVVALFGGAVGVSNIMLVSVTERTKEIGTIRAIGGSRRDVLQMFLFEALMVSLTGVVLGMVGGAALGYGLMRLPILGLHLPLVYNLVWFPIAAGIGLATGLAAGVYPALKAARVVPVKALKYE